MPYHQSMHVMLPDIHWKKLSLKKAFYFVEDPFKLKYTKETQGDLLI